MPRSRSSQGGPTSTERVSSFRFPVSSDRKPGLTEAALFGSYAYGQPRPDSDIDLLVVLPFPNPKFSNKTLSSARH
jgi:predicted nucleotidyltransferase